MPLGLWLVASALGSLLVLQLVMWLGGVLYTALSIQEDSGPERLLDGGLWVTWLLATVLIACGGWRALRSMTGRRASP